MCLKVLSVSDYCNDGTRHGLFELLTETLQHLKFTPIYFSDSTDSAASYHGQYNGLQSKTADVADQYVYIWCCVHL